jgi:hypothetical protein
VRIDKGQDQPPSTSESKRKVRAGHASSVASSPRRARRPLPSPAHFISAHLHPPGICYPRDSASSHRLGWYQTLRASRDSGMGRRCVSPHIINTLPLILAIRNRDAARIHMLLYHLRRVAYRLCISSPLSSLGHVPQRPPILITSVGLQRSTNRLHFVYPCSQKNTEIYNTQRREQSTHLWSSTRRIDLLVRYTRLYMDVY